MEFDKEHKTKIETLNIIEAEEYIEFLERERTRHYEVWLRCQARSKFWGSEALRQKEELEKLEDKLKKVKEKFGL